MAYEHVPYFAILQCRYTIVNTKIIIRVTLYLLLGLVRFKSDIFIAVTPKYIRAVYLPVFPFVI